MSEPSKVYIVTSGAHSTYAIRTVFSTRELAEAFIAKYGDAFDVDVAEAEIEECAASGDALSRAGRPESITVRLAPNGDVESVEIITPVSIGGPDDPQAVAIYMACLPSQRERLRIKASLYLYRRACRLVTPCVALRFR